jgi:hypothetical protein
MSASGKYLPHIALADAMVDDFEVNDWLVELFNCFPKLMFKRHKTGPLLSSSKQQAAYKGQMPWLELKGSAILLAFKRLQWIKNGEVINLQ